MNKLIISIVIVFVVVGGFLLLKQMSNRNESENTGLGKVVISITDAAVDMANISEIMLTVSKVELRSESTGWITASSATNTYNLLELKARNESAFAAGASVSAGTYNQIRVTLDSIKVRTTAGAVSDAKLPSGQFKINGDIVVKAGETSSVNLDFLASASLHKTGNGLFVFTPVVHMEVRGNANVKILPDNDDRDDIDSVEIEDGEVEEEVDAGMDIDGEVKNDFKIKEDAKVKIENGVIKIIED